MALFLTIRERCLTGGRPKPPCTNTKKQTRNHRHRPKHIARRVKRHGKAPYNGQLPRNATMPATNFLPGESWLFSIHFTARP